MADGALVDFLWRTWSPGLASASHRDEVQEVFSDPDRAAAIFERYLAMTRDAAADDAEFILWPESATPFYFDEDPRSAERVRRLVSEIKS